jgi:hypothetical protein
LDEVRSRVVDAARAFVHPGIAPQNGVPAEDRLAL